MKSTLIYNPLIEIHIEFSKFPQTLSFLFFRCSTDILSFTFISPISQIHAQWLTTSRIRSHIEYLMPTCNILLFVLHSNFTPNLSLCGSQADTNFCYYAARGFLPGPPWDYHTDVNFRGGFFQLQLYIYETSLWPERITTLSARWDTISQRRTNGRMEGGRM